MIFDRNSSIIISYRKLRTLIGVLGMSLPVLCFLWSYAGNSGIVLDSISSYYFSNFRDVFVGILVAFSVFLVSYRGYTVLDNLTTNVIGLCGLGTALFPCANEGAAGPVGVFMVDGVFSNIIHLVSAGLFFVLLAFNALFLFTKSNEVVQKHTAKWYRNLIYRICGSLILICMIAMIPALLCDSSLFPGDNHAVLVLETIMLFAFGISWLVKGSSLFSGPNGKKGTF